MDTLPYLLFMVCCCMCPLVDCFDEFMYCARVTRTQRALLEKVPCDLSKDTYCTEPGNVYPWRTMRSFINENQGTMKRMYGEARQLNILKSEFSDTVDYNNGFLENTFFYDDDALHRYRKRPTFKPPLTQSPTSEQSTTTSTTESSSDFQTDPIEELPLAQPLIGYANETSVDALEINDEAIDQMLNIQDQVTYAELTPTEEAALEAEEDILSTLSTDFEPPTRELQTKSRNSSVSTITLMPKVSTTSILENTTVQATTNPTLLTSTNSSTTESTTSKRTTSTTSTTTTVKPTKKPALKPSTIRTKKPLPVEGNLRTPRPQRQKLPNIPPQLVSKEKSSYYPVYGGNACETKEEVFAPYWVNSTKGKVYAAMNIYPYEQFIHYEKCTNERHQMYCRDGCRCEQQYSLHRLLVFDVLNECRGIFSDWFRMPSSCVCKCYFHPGDPRSSSRRPRVYEETREQRLRRKAAEAYEKVRKFTEEAESAGKFDDPRFDPELDSDIFHSRMGLLDEIERQPVIVDPLVMDGARNAKRLSLRDEKVKSNLVEDKSEVTTAAPELQSSTSEETTKTPSFSLKDQTEYAREEIRPSASVKKQLKSENFREPIEEKRIPRRPVLEVAKDIHKVKYKTARSYQLNIESNFDNEAVEYSDYKKYPVQWAKPVSEGSQILKNPR
ncbi:protein spaetzle 4-like [Artemia franciscana]|uniref:Spaetzle domain-containing protein n=1 Tax=Artemia franciscana TaxID=6661 RepID=A0AA88LBT9_ARTSF|nr:hypothetical protein QYM36_000193 [Artemia franciscana]